MSYYIRQPSRSRPAIGFSNAPCTPMMTTIRPNNKFSRSSSTIGWQNRGNLGRQPYGAGAGKLNESGWSFGAPSCPPGPFQQPQRHAAYATQNSFNNNSMNGRPAVMNRNNSSIGISGVPSYQQQQQRGRGGTMYPNSTSTVTQPPAYISPVGATIRARAPTAQQSRPRPVASVNVNPSPAHSSTNGEQQLPPEGENVKYIRMNWEDILGGRDGMNQMRVMMAPPTKDNPNRQLSIGFGNSTDGPTPDGSIPLKVLKFEPLENYPGQMTTSAAASANTSVTNSPSPSPRASLSNMAAGNYARPQPQVQMGSPQYMNMSGGVAGQGSNPQMQQLMSGISVKQSADGQPIITLPPGFKLANSAAIGMNNGTSGGSANGQMQCACPACQFRQPTSVRR